MKLTQRLVNYLHRVFDRSPQQFIALRIHCNGSGMTWKVRDAVLTTAPVGGAASALSINLDGNTVASLASYIAAQPGYMVSYVDNTALSLLSSQVLIDGNGDISKPNGDHLYGYTSVVWAYMDACAQELEAAGAQIGQMLLQMNTVTASGTWLDLQGAYYGVPRNIGEGDAQYGPRIIATVIRPLGNNVAIEAALKVLDGSLKVSVTDVTVPVNNSYGLFDVAFEVGLSSLPTQTLQAWQAAIASVINSMRDAGTHMSRLSVEASVEATPALGAVVTVGQRCWVYPA